ncbi:hypothetical protein SAMN05421818_10925 [Myroides phaeus]|uniref:Uncharacterized protein n=1 Tax=Myroides phaeus TaxID=702745 RepID=A0A1G8E2G2_9FLAO|nr:hypothetical protein SAMN05421818_10925 [Myroides phaeus]
MTKRSIRVIWFAFMYVVFLVPHISNLLHYVIIEHQYGVRTNKTEWVDADTVHYCDQYLYKISPAFVIDIVEWEPFYVHQYIEKAVFNECLTLLNTINFYWLRGPPNVFYI